MFWKNKKDKDLQKILAENKALKEENAELRLQVQELQEKIFGKRKKKKPKKKDEEDLDPEEEPKKRGVPEGHPGWFRKRPKDIDHVRDVTLDECPECHSKNLKDTGKIQEHIQEDIIFIARPESTLYNKHQYICCNCDGYVQGRGAEELPNAYIGPRAKALAIFLKYRIKISDRDIKKLFQSMMGLTLVPSSIPGFRNQLSRYCKPLHEELLKRMRESKYLHADETGWKNDGWGMWLWNFSNKDVSISQIQEGRGQKEVKNVLGNEFDGVLITDFLSAYNRIKAKGKQRCWVHLLRDLKKIKDNFPNDKAAQRFVKRLETILSKALKLIEKYESKQITKKEIREQKERLQTQLDDLQLVNPTHKRLRTLTKRLHRHKDELLTFLDYPGVVDYHNNHAERQIRPNVLLRKIVFGNRSEAGILNHNCLMSIIQTAVLKGLDPLKTLRDFLFDYDKPNAIASTIPP